MKKLKIRKEASELVLTVMIWAVASLLSARLYLSLMDWPQIGKGDWHVAHALLGGLIMVAGMIVELAVEGWSKKAAGIFGFGLGWFIDEIGKFLSRDNDYFFRPAVMLIYLFFVIIFLIYRYLEKKDEGEEKPAVGWGRLKGFAYRIFKKKPVLGLLLGVAGIYTISGIWDFIFLIGRRDFSGLDLLTIKATADVATAGCFGIGIFLVANKRKRKGLSFFQTGLLVNIFIANVAKFYFEQMAGVFGLGITMAVYYGLGRLKRE